jgi:hypothetical protein
MRILLTVVLAFVLAGCGALAPAAPTAAPTASPEVIIQTVVVTVIPTEQPTEMPAPTLAPTATPEVIVVTATPGAPGPTSEAAVTSPAESPTATLPANAGGDLFTSLTRSSDHFALRCLPETITFGVSTSNVYVVGVDIYYRIEDRLSVSMSGWVNGGSMVSDKHGNFTLDFPSSRVAPDLRSHRAWFDYQFVGTNKTGDAVGRSLRIVKQITYTIDCTD